MNCMVSYKGLSSSQTAKLSLIHQAHGKHDTSCYISLERKFNAERMELQGAFHPKSNNKCTDPVNETGSPALLGFTAAHEKYNKGLGFFHFCTAEAADLRQHEVVYWVAPPQVKVRSLYAALSSLEDNLKCK